MQAKIQGHANTTKKTEGDNSFHKTEIGLLPKDWKVVRLGDVAETKSGGTPSRKKPEYFNGNIPWVKSGKLDDNVIYDTEEKITKEALLNSSAKVFPKGTLLIAMYGATVGKTAILAIDASTNQAVCAIFPKNKSFLSEFMRYYLAFIRPKLLSERFGGAQPNISQTIIRNSKIALPPLPEQQRIAGVLGTIQRAIEQQDKILEATKNLKISLIQKLFTKGLGHREFRETEIGKIPTSWQVAKLGDLGDFQYGYTTSAKEDPVGPKFLRISDINDEGKILWGGVPYCRIPESKFGKYKLQVGDILVARIGATTGKTCIIQRAPEAIFASYLIRIQVQGSNRTYPLFVYYFANSSIYWAQINANKEGKLKKGVSASFLKTVRIPLPSIDEQKEIAYMLNTVDKKIEVEEKRKDTLKELFKTTLHELMTAEIRLKDVEV